MENMTLTFCELLNYPTLILWEMDLGISLCQDSSFIVTTTFWNCGGKGHKSDECPSKSSNSSQPKPNQGKVVCS